MTRAEAEQQLAEYETAIKAAEAREDTVYARGITFHARLLRQAIEAGEFDQ